MTAKNFYNKTFCAVRNRAFTAFKNAGVERTLMDCSMDLIYADQDVGLDFDKLLTAPDRDFEHDIFGIARHLDHNTLKLTNCFLPRCATKKVETADTTPAPQDIRVIVEGGMVRGVYIDGLYRAADVLDFDIEGASEDELTSTDTLPPATELTHAATSYGKFFISSST